MATLPGRPRRPPEPASGPRSRTRRAWGLAFSPDGTRLASGGDNQEVILWDAAGGSLLHRPEGQGGPIQPVAFTPDGRHLVSAGNGRTVRVWDAAGGREVACLRGHTHVVQDVAASGDGRRLLSASGYGTVRESDWAASTAGWATPANDSPTSRSVRPGDVSFRATAAGPSPCSGFPIPDLGLRCRTDSWPTATTRHTTGRL